MWKGIDVSDNQGTINWEKVKNAGADFAVLRSIKRSGKPDNQFAANLAGCISQHIPCSVYKYTYAVTEQAARVEAEQVISLLRLSGLHCMVWWDVEDRNVLYPLGREKITACIKAAQKVIETAGFPFGIYTGLYVYKEKWFYFEDFSCPLWIARYPSTAVKSLSDDPNEKYLPNVGRPILGWQFSNNGKVDGIAASVDLDISYVDPLVFSGQQLTSGRYALIITELSLEQYSLLRETIRKIGINGLGYQRLEE